MSVSMRLAAGRVELAAIVTLALAGCMSSSGIEPHRERLGAEIRERGVDPLKIVIPFELDASMRAWAQRFATSGIDDHARLDALLEGVLHRDDVNLRYEDGTTATAREVWRTKLANCLSFAHLYVGLAREIGLPVYYLRVLDVEGFEKNGDLVVASKHIAVGFGPPSQRRVIEFTNLPVKPQRELEAVSDVTAIALYYSDLGAQRIRERRVVEAEELLRTAVRLGPELGETWVNFGVALRRLGRIAEAEASFRRALELDPHLVPAYNNLSALLERDGRSEEARALLEATDRRGNRNPFSYLALGDLSLREGRLSDAERFYRHARRCDPQRPEPLAALGQWALAAGRREEAERWLAKASQLDAANPRTHELARQLRDARNPRGWW